MESVGVWFVETGPVYEKYRRFYGPFFTKNEAMFAARELAEALYKNFGIEGMMHINDDRFDVWRVNGLSRNWFKVMLLETFVKTTDPYASSNELRIRALEKAVWG